MRWLFAAILALGLATTAAPRAWAEMITAQDVEAIVEVARLYGPADLERSSSGDPRIVGEIDGTTYLVVFYGCQNGRSCTDIQFGAAWAAGSPADRSDHLAKVNQWNAESRFGNAYIETDGAVFLKMETNLQYGVERDSLIDTFDWWRIALVQFPDFFYE